MKAIVVRGTPKQPELVWADVSDVEYRADEVLVNIRATAINRADLSQVRGNYDPPPGVTDIPGLEMAGEITAVGPSVSGWQPGDRVCALLAGGGYAEQVAVHPGMLMRLPDEWSFAQGAAIPEVWLTAFLNLFLEAGLQPGETALIHAGGSGVGTAAVQLVTVSGATAYVTAGTEEKLARCRQLGAQLAINYKEVDFLPAIREATGEAGVDVILDPVGADYFERNLQALGESGRLVHIGLLSGSKTDIDLGLLMGKSLRLIGSRLRPRPLAEKIEITRRFREQYWSMLAEGRLEPVIDSVYPVEEAQAAHEYVRQNRNLGKVVLQVH